MGDPDPDVGDLTGAELMAELSGDPDTFVSLTGHLYRAEVERMTAWRNRLDQTTNWAVVLMAAILTFAFASEENPHYVLLVGVLAVSAFLVIESQRYQEYDAWRKRVRLLQRHLMAGALVPDDADNSTWRDRLAADLRNPELTYPIWRALGHRLKRVYFLLLSVLLAAWLLRISVFQPDETWQQTASVADVPGSLVVVAVVVMYLLAGAVAGWSIWVERVREFGNQSTEE